MVMAGAHCCDAKHRGRDEQGGNLGVSVDPCMI